MAITIAAHTGSEVDFWDRFGIGFPLELEYNISFGEDIAGRLVHINLFMWGLENDIEKPQPLPPHPLGQGYNHIHNGVNSYQPMALAGVSPDNYVWANKTVEIRYPNSSSARIRVRFIHTHDLGKWLHVGGVSNEKRLLHATPSTPELTYEYQSYYYPGGYVNRYLGIRAQLWEQLESGAWKYNIGKDEAIQRYWAWFWNPNNETETDWPYSAVRYYYFSLYRDNIPVTTLSTTQDTDVVFEIERHTGNTFATTYHVGLMKVIPTPQNDDYYWNAIPYPLGLVTTTNTFNTAVSWHHKTINSVDIVDECTTFDVVSGDNLKCEFTIPKEVVEPGCIYRIVVIIKITFTGEPP